MKMPLQASRGFGLIELMVAMTISLVLVAATLTLYLDMSRNNNELAKTNMQMESGRLAIALLRDDLIHAGFWDGFIPMFDDMTAKVAPTDYPDDIPSPCAAFSSWSAAGITNRIGLPVDLYADVPSDCSSVLPDKVEDSDILVVRHVQTCAAGDAGCEAEASGKLYWQTSGCEGESAYLLATSGLNLNKIDCSTPAPLRKFVNNIYYLRDHAVTAGDGIPTLMVSTLDLSGGSVTQLAASPMIEGVEAMRFEFAVDAVSDSGEAIEPTAAVLWANDKSRTSPRNRGDGAPDATCTSSTPCGLDDLANTVAVKVHLLVRSLEPTQGYSSTKTYSLAGETFGPYSDAFQRHVYSTTVRLINVSGRRETP